MTQSTPRPATIRCPASWLGAVGLVLALAGPAVAGDAPDRAAFDLTHYRGKTVYLDFWASWCAPCRESFSFMNAMDERYSDRGLEIVAVNLDADSDAAQAFLEAYPAEFDVVFDPEGQVAEQFAPPAMPTTLIFDTEGRLVVRHTGFFPGRRKDYEETIVAAIEPECRASLQRRFLGHVRSVAPQRAVRNLHGYPTFPSSVETQS